MLKLTDVHTYYGPVHALKGVSLEVGEGEIVSLLGGNASGKSTTMKSILGLARPRQGTIEYCGNRIDGQQPSEVVRAGISPVLERRRLFPYLTVEENLAMGAYLRRDKARIKADLERMCVLFPIVREHRTRLAASLSGGEQQMVAMARALMARPKLLIMDEPSMGPVAQVRRDDVRDHPGDQPQAGRVDPAGRTERQHGAVHRRARLRAADRGDRPGRQRGRAARQSADAEGLPGGRLSAPQRWDPGRADARPQRKPGPGVPHELAMAEADATGRDHPDEDKEALVGSSVLGFLAQESRESVVQPSRTQRGGTKRSAGLAEGPGGKFQI